MLLQCRIIGILYFHFLYTDLITPAVVKGYKEDLKWRFTKVAMEDGIFDRQHIPFSSEHTLVIF